jgi:hypothetical protein
VTNHEGGGEANVQCLTFNGQPPTPKCRTSNREKHGLRRFNQYGRYSVLNAVIGFTWVARRAGRKHASNAASASIKLDAKSANGSLGLTSYKIWARTRPAANESRIPTVTASAVCSAPWRMIREKTSCRRAPKAMRIPISRVRHATAYAFTP